MEYNPIITVGRQYGSGGRYVAKLVAEKLGIPYYDKELLVEASKDSGICQEVLEDYDEKHTRSLLFSLISGVQPRGEAASMYMDMPLNHKIFLAQFDTIRRIADEGPCVIVGRCADYILENRPELVRVFLYGDLKDRVARKEAMGLEITESDMTKHVQVTDRKRSRYYRNFTGQVWGAKENYDICLNTSVTGIDGAVAMLKTLVEKRNQAE